MNSTEPAKNDVLAQKRAATPPSQETSVVVNAHIAKTLGESSGRAFWWSFLNDAGTWSATETRDRAAFGREWLAALIDADPLAVGSMWSEAMAREFAKRAGIPQ